MKKGWKIFWIICASVMGLGMICCVAALVLGVNLEMMESGFYRGFGWVVKSGSSDYMEDIRKEFTDVCKIDADIYAGEVRIRLADVEQVTVETDHVREDLEFRCSQEDDELKLETNDHLWQKNHREDGSITVYLPADRTMEEVKIDLGIGSLYLENVCADELDVDAGAGEAEVLNICAGQAKIGAGVGSVTASGQIQDSLELEAGVGEIVFTASGNEEDYNYNIDVGVGEVLCGETSFSGLGCEKRIDYHAPREIAVTCGVGTVKLKFDGQTAAGEKEECHHGDEKTAPVS